MTSSPQFEKEVKGIFDGWFETGTEGTYWSLQDENYIDENGMYSYDGLKLIKNGDHLTIFWPKSENVAWEGEVKLLRKFHIDNAGEYKKYFGHYIKAAPSGYKQLSLCGRWVHSIPMNVDLGLWYEVFLAERHKFHGILKKVKEKQKWPE